MIIFLKNLWVRIKKYKFVFIAGWVIKFGITVFVIIQAACNDSYTPKPQAYHKIDFPEKSYQASKVEHCPFSFEYPSYTTIEQDSLFFNEKVENPCWMDINFDRFKGVLHLSYKTIKQENDFAKYVDDAHKLTFKHTIKAESIDEYQIETPNQVGGMIYEVGGDAASSVQFFLTDTNTHFLRGALYFSNTPNADSIAPVVKFVKEDMRHLIDTFQWN